jgi:hypothetical protein
MRECECECECVLDEEVGKASCWVGVARPLDDNSRRIYSCCNDRFSFYGLIWFSIPPNQVRSRSRPTLWRKKERNRYASHVFL